MASLLPEKSDNFVYSVCSLIYLACKVHALDRIVIYGLSGSIIFYHLIS